MPNDYNALTSEDVAARLRRSTSTLAKWRMTGRGPKFCKAGRSVIYLAEDVDAWLATRKRRSTSDTGEAQHAA